ncbi:MAG: chemotaxis protein CheW [Synechococcus sp.]
MPLLTTPRRRRLASTYKQATRQLISFQLRQEWCALPIDSVEKVVLMGTVYGDPNQTGVSVTPYEGRELVVVDVGYRIFGDAQAVPSNRLESQTVRFLLIVRDNSGNRVGLPIDSAPAVQRVPVDSVAPLSTAYQSEGSLQCVSSLAVQSEDSAPIFLLDTEKICNTQ